MNKTTLSLLAIGLTFALGYSQNKSSLFSSDTIPSPFFNYKPFVSKQKKPNSFYLNTQQPTTFKEALPVAHTYSISIVEPKGYFPTPNYHTEDKTKRSLVIITPK